MSHGQLILTQYIKDTISDIDISVRPSLMPKAQSFLFPSVWRRETGRETTRVEQTKDFKAKLKNFLKALEKRA